MSAPAESHTEMVTPCQVIMVAPCPCMNMMAHFSFQLLWGMNITSADIFSAHLDLFTTNCVDIIAPILCSMPLVVKLIFSLSMQASASIHFSALWKLTWNSFLTSNATSLPSLTGRFGVWSIYINLWSTINIGRSIRQLNKQHSHSKLLVCGFCHL